MSTLDLDVEVFPCPKDGATWRPKAIELGGKKQFPYLVDPNTGMVRGAHVYVRLCGAHTENIHPGPSSQRPGMSLRSKSDAVDSWGGGWRSKTTQSAEDVAGALPALQSMYESDEIVAYLFRTYGPRTVPLPLALGQLTNISAALGLAPRCVTAGW